MKPSGLCLIGTAVALVAWSACEFGVVPEEGGTASSPTSQRASLEGEMGAPPGEATAPWGTHGESPPQGSTEPMGAPVPASPPPCVPTVSGVLSWPCVPARQTGDRSHGDPQPWQPAPVPQPY